MANFKKRLIELVHEETKLSKEEIDEHVITDFFSYTYPEPLSIIAQENYLRGFLDCYKFIIETKEFLK
jgi:hypothetical protein